MSLRPDFALISEWIAPGSRVLDLGCGDGTLLRHLRETRQVSGYGLEIDDANIVRCLDNGVDVIQSDLNEGLSEFFDDDSFDYVIMTQTLQAMRHPDRLIEEMARVGREGIVTFPNMAHWKNRLQLAVGGRMPVSRVLPYAWYDTPNIHLCTLHDFERLCEEKGLRILERAVVDAGHRKRRLAALLPNLMSEIAVYRFTRA